MDQALLYKSVEDAGFSVLEFSDHPGFFGSWYVVVKRGRSVYRVVHEGRDSWLLFYRQEDDSRLEQLAAVESHTMSHEEEVAQCKQWLTSVKA